MCARSRVRRAATTALFVACFMTKWVPWIDGGEWRQWRHELESVLLWSMRGLQIVVAPVNRYGRGEEVYFRAGIAFTMIGISSRHALTSIVPSSAIWARLFTATG